MHHAEVFMRSLLRSLQCCSRTVLSTSSLLQQEENAQFDTLQQHSTVCDSIASCAKKSKREREQAEAAADQYTIEC
eukprot:1750-Heterococcus_DN1.PRE.4